MRSSTLLASLSVVAWACSQLGPPDVHAPANPTGSPPTATLSPTSSAPPTRPNPPVVTPPPVADVTKLAQGSNAFGFDLYRRLEKDAGSVVVSPASITMALAMAWGGAQGETAEEMRRVLHFDGSANEVMATAGRLSRSLESPSRPITFRIANRLFGERTYEFKQPFLEQVESAYGAPLERLGFKKDPEAARRTINGWVEQRTEERIRDLVPSGSISRLTCLVLVNAIYFLGDWELPFEPDQTRPAAFFTQPAQKVDVPTMEGIASYKYVKQGGVQALELPYKGGELSMVIVLPDAVDGLSGLEKAFDAKQFDDLVKSMQGETVRARIPKFEVAPAASISLGAHLVEMGMKAAFDREKADFSLIANGPLFLEKVFHKGFVKVDEKGTEAAAATAAQFQLESGTFLSSKPTEFKADHPFLFVIRDNASGLVLFLGRVVDPSKK